MSNLVILNSYLNAQLDYFLKFLNVLLALFYQVKISFISPVVLVDFENIPIEVVQGYGSKGVSSY
jgi:hypothetical protein